MTESAGVHREHEISAELERLMTEAEAGHPELLSRCQELADAMGRLTAELVGLRMPAVMARLMTDIEGEGS